MMKTRKKSLQKLTESEKRMNKLFEMPTISYEDLNGLNEQERNDFFAMATKKVNQLDGDELDVFYQKVKNVISEDSKNHMWEHNHNLITWAISALMQELGRMPTNNEIATKAKLSRQTIHKHLKEYANEPKFQEMQDQFRFMTSKVLAKVFKFAVNGDMKAAKLYLETFGNLKTSSFFNQTNFIQINQVKISQDNIKQLNPDQLIKLEEIFRNIISTN